MQNKITLLVSNISCDIKIPNLSNIKQSVVKISTTERRQSIHI